MRGSIELGIIASDPNKECPGRARHLTIFAPQQEPYQLELRVSNHKQITKESNQPAAKLRCRPGESPKKKAPAEQKQGMSRGVISKVPPAGSSRD